MKILQTPARFYPYIGGTEQVVFYLSKELVKRGHEVKVICANEPYVGNSIIEGIEVKRLPFLGKIANTNITFSLLQELLREDFDIIHTHLPHPWSADISAIVSSLKKKPLFLTYHNDITGRGMGKLIANIYNVSALKFLLKKAYKIFITNDNYIKSSPFLKSFIDKIVVSPPGVDLEKFKPLDLPRSNENIIFFLSRLDKFHSYKGLEYLILAVKEIIQKVPLKLYIGGEGELMEYYLGIVKEKDLAESVLFLGKLSGEDSVRYYNNCDVFVLPSVSSVQEGFGLVALEAMACRKAVIVSKITGVAEDVKKYDCGLVVEPAKVAELSEALLYILSNERRHKEMADNSYNLVVNKYTWNKHAAIVESEYLKRI